MVVPVDQVDLVAAHRQLPRVRPRLPALAHRLRLWLLPHRPQALPLPPPARRLPPYQFSRPQPRRRRRLQRGNPAWPRPLGAQAAAGKEVAAEAVPAPRTPDPRS